MTTREQLGLNANWIPMDSSKSGGSDEFLVKKVNQLEEKVNEMELSSFRPPLVSTADMAELKYEEITEDNKHFLKLYLIKAPENSKVRFKANNKEFIVTPSKPVKFEMNEIIDPKLAEYGVHCFSLLIHLLDVLVSGVSDFKFGSEFNTVITNISVQGYRVTDLSISAFKVMDNNATKISYYTRGYDFSKSTESKAEKLVKYSTLKNVFTTDYNLQTDVPVYLHPSYVGFVTRTPSASGAIIESQRIKTLEILSINTNNSVTLKEHEFTWKGPEDLMKDKLQPMILCSPSRHDVDQNFRYGYYGNKIGLPVLVYAPNLSTFISYIYKTDLSEWLGYFSDSASGMFIKNAKQVPRTTKIAFSKRTEKGYTNRDEPSYIYDNSLSTETLYDSANTRVLAYNSGNAKKYDDASHWSSDNAVNTLLYRGHVGLVVSDFDNGKTVEVWDFCHKAVRSAEVNIVTQNLSSLINSETGEFNTDHQLYNQWKNNKCVLHQTLQRVGQEIKVAKLEVTTLDVFFKNFIDKSEGWKSKNPDKVEVEGRLKGDYDRKWSWDDPYDHL